MLTCAHAHPHVQVIMRIRDPKSTALIFHSGKMVCTGTKSEQEARTAARKYAKILQKLSYQVSFKVRAVGACGARRWCHRGAR